MFQNLKDIWSCSFSYDDYLQLKRSVNLKWVKDLNIRPETVKLLEENIGEQLLDIVFGNNFLDDTKSKNQSVKMYQLKKLLHSEWSEKKKNILAESNKLLSNQLFGKRLG